MGEILIIERKPIMTRKKKWAQLTTWVGSVNYILEHYLQFRRYKEKEFIKVIRKKDKFAIFVIPDKDEVLTPEECKKIFRRFLSL